MKQKVLMIATMIAIMACIFVGWKLVVAGGQTQAAPNPGVEWSDYIWSPTNSTQVYGYISFAGDNLYEYVQKISVNSDTFEISYLSAKDPWTPKDMRARIRESKAPYNIVPGSDIDLPDPVGFLVWVTGTITLKEILRGDYWFCIYKADSGTWYGVGIDNDRRRDTPDFYKGWPTQELDDDKMIRVRQRLGVNYLPTASIISINPKTQVEKKLVTFVGSGTDPDGHIVAYEWKSNLDGTLSYTNTFSTSGLSVGVHKIYFRVKDNDGEWSDYVSETLTINPPTPPDITNIYATHDGLGTQDDEHVGVFISGVAVRNDFFVWANMKDFPVAKVKFELWHENYLIDEEEVTNPSEDGRWVASFDMGDLPHGVSKLKAVAFDEVGTASETKEVNIRAISKPSWFNQDWIFNSECEFDYGNEEYTFSGIIPANPRLRWEKSFDIPYLGTLQNLFEAGVEITEKFRINGDWEYKASGGLNVRLLGQSFYGFRLRDFTIERADSTGYGRDLERYRFKAGPFSIAQHKVNVFKGTIATIWVDGIKIDIRLSIDFGMDAEVTMSGNILSDLKVEEIRTVPEISPYVEIDVCADILYGVATVGTKATPTFEIELPIVYRYDRDPKLYPESPCVSFILKIKFYVKVLWGLGQVETETYEAAKWSWGCEGSSSNPKTLANPSGSEARALPELFNSPSIAYDDYGNAVVVWVQDEDPDPAKTDPELYYSFRPSGGIWSWPRRMFLQKNDLWETDPKVVFLESLPPPKMGKVMVVWTQNKIPKDEAPAVGDLAEVLSAQDIYYSILVAPPLIWSSPSPVISDTLPDGRASLAADPTTGDAMVVWIKDMDGSLDPESRWTMNDWEVYYRHWDGGAGGWSGAPLSLTADNSADVQVDVTLTSGGKAMAVWVKDKDGNFWTNYDRDIMYSTWDPAKKVWTSESVAVSQPGVLWPSVAYDSEGEEAVMVFTIRTRDPAGNDTGEGIKDILCSAQFANDAWHAQPIFEPVPLEAPFPTVPLARWPKVDVVNILGTDYAVAVYRGFDGFGTDGFDGEVGMAVAKFVEPPQWEPLYLEWSTALLTYDSLLDWQIDFDMDPEHDLASIVWVNPECIPSFPSPFPELTDYLCLIEMPIGVDLRTALVGFSNRRPMAGNPVRITARVHNDGFLDVEEGENFTVKFYKGDPELGEEIGSVRVEPVKSKKWVDVSIEWVAEGGAQDIFVVLDAGKEVQEIEEGNNVGSATLGLMPSPSALTARFDLVEGGIHLSWEAPDVRGLAGYRVYRSAVSGENYSLIAITEMESYVDKNVAPDTDYHYVVRAFDVYGVESEPSNEVVCRFPLGVGILAESPPVKVPQIRAGETGEFLIENTLVTKLEVSIGWDVSNISLSVQELDGMPIWVVTPPPELIYRYFRVVAENVSRRDVVSSIIEFRVEEHWIRTSDADEERVTLNRYDPVLGKWTVLPTRKIGEEAGYVYYSAEAPGLSIFAVTASPRAPVPAVFLPIVLKQFKTE
jgi:PGF-pre-PGF domain-containing protein